ncbi:carbonic anhydrase [Pseudoscourfieldia marina]
MRNYHGAYFMQSAFVAFVAVCLLLLAGDAPVRVAAQQNRASSAAQTQAWNKDINDPMQGPNAWPGTCQTGQQQSPIDIPLKDGNLKYGSSTSNNANQIIQAPATSLRVAQSNGAPVFTCPTLDQRTAGSCGSLTVGGVTYNFLQANFHTPSEHTVNGKQFDMEMRMAYCTGNCQLGVDKFAVVGVLFEGVNTAAPHAGLSKLWNYVASDGILGPAMSLSELYDGTSGAWNWKGSLTMPPCTEGLEWVLLSTPTTVAQSQIDAFYAHVGGTISGKTRPVQPLYSRTINDMHSGAQKEAKYTWDHQAYNGPAGWGMVTPEWATCMTGREQSPIDIPKYMGSGASTAFAASSMVTSPSSVSLKVTQSHGAPKYSCGSAPERTSGSCGSLSFGGVTYNFLQAHFHTPSENTVDGKQFDMEMHMVHCTGNCELGVDKFAVVSVLFNGATMAAPHAGLSKLWDFVAADGNAATNPLSLGDLYDGTSGAWNWKGSLTTPPCTEGLEWVLLSTPTTVAQSQIDAFYAHIGGAPGNARPVQPIYDRTINDMHDNADTTKYSWSPVAPNGPSKWGQLAPEWSVCATGREQSPIDIPMTAQSMGSGASTAFAASSMVTSSSVSMKVTQAKGGPKYSCPTDVQRTSGSCGSLSFGGLTYNFLQAHFHTPSENTVDGKQFDMEMHMVHCTGNCELSVDKFAVVSVLFDGMSTASPHAGLSKLWNYVASDGVLSPAMSLSELYDGTSGAWNWKGSLTTPPCTEGLEWVLLSTPTTVAQSQIDAFYAHIGGAPGNARPVQPLYSRTISDMHGGGSPKYSYGLTASDGPSKWGLLSSQWAVCATGREQSPIDIPMTAQSMGSGASTAFAASTMVSSPSSVSLKVTQSHGAPTYSCGSAPERRSGSCGSLSFGGLTYNFLQAHFHTPSENTVDGKQFDMEMHMVHCTGNCELGVDKFAVVGVLFNVLNTASPHAGLSKLWNYVASDGGVKTDKLSLADLYDGTSGAWNWKGSLTTPPCTEGLEWVLLSTPTTVAQSQIDAFYAHIGGAPGNARPVQPLYSRTINDMHGGGYSYGLTASDGPAKWGVLNTEWAMCTAGREQSPIDIPMTAQSMGSGASTAFAASTMVSSPSSVSLKVTQSHGAPKYSCGSAPERRSGSCGSLSFGGLTYNFLQAHFHTPSENTVDGKQFDMEMHMVHCTGNCKLGVDKFAVVSVLFDGMSTATPHAGLSKLWNYVASDGAKTDKLSLTDLYDGTSGAWNWKGSLTTPPCTEGLEWVLLSTPTTVAQSQIDAFYAHIGGAPGNARPVQPLYSRTINDMHGSALAPSAGNAAPPKYSYSLTASDGPSKWGLLSSQWAVCATGREQSPINIPMTVQSMGSGATTAFAASTMVTSPSSVSLKVTQSHGAPKYSCGSAPERRSGSCGSLQIGGRSYNFLQAHFHTPSENTVDGKQFDMEMHMVHCTGNCELGVDKFAVVGVLFNGATMAAPHAGLSKLWNYVASDGGVKTDKLSLADLYDGTSGAWNWKGSLTTPPCTEGLEWVLLSTPTTVAQSQIDAFYAHIGGAPGNARPVQPLFSRSIVDLHISGGGGGSSGGSKGDINALPRGAASGIAIAGCALAFTLIVVLTKGRIWVFKSSLPRHNQNSREFVNFADPNPRMTSAPPTPVHQYESYIHTGDGARESDRLRVISHPGNPQWSPVSHAHPSPDRLRA